MERCSVKSITPKCLAYNKLQHHAEVITPNMDTDAVPKSDAAKDF